MKRLLALILALMLLIPASAEYSEYLQFDSVITRNDSDGSRYFFCLKDGVWQLYKADGTLLLDWEWEESNFDRSDSHTYFYGFGEGNSALVNLNPAGNVYALIDREGKYLLRPTTCDIYRLPEGMYKIIIDYMEGLLDPQGNFIIEPIYKYIGSFEDGMAEFRDEEGWGLLDVNGNILLKPIYNGVERMDDGSYRAYLNGEEVYYSLQNGAMAPLSTVGTSVNLDAYKPFEGVKTPRLDEPADLLLTSSFPRLDGATALFPMYSGVVEAVYPKDVRFEEAGEAENPVITFTNTPGAYQRLIDGDCDLIFVARPSNAQLEAAKKEGVEFHPTVIAKEAFVFFVNKDNPLDNITTEQIRHIYSGKITSWDDLGVEDIGDIVAYQRPENSGSQTALQNLMGDAPLMEPPSETDFVGMDDIINVVEYRNYPNAIGYSFRFFLSEMMESDVKLLAVDGIEPTIENIQNGSYPIIADLYAVSRKGDDNPSLHMLLDWLVSEQGQELVKRSGYVPVN